MDEYPLDSYHRVSSHELDSFGHVNNAIYLNYLEKARNDFLLQRGLSFQLFADWKKFPVVTAARLQFKKPALAGDLLHISGRITAHAETSFSLMYRIVHVVMETVVLLAETDHVFIDEQNRPTRIPAEFREKFLKN